MSTHNPNRFRTQASTLVAQALILALAPALASADALNVKPDPSGQGAIAQVRGARRIVPDLPNQASGPAAELLGVFQKAGVPFNQGIEGATYAGKNFVGTVSGKGGWIHYSVHFKAELLKDALVTTGQHQTLRLRGKPAAELLAVMRKAGLGATDEAPAARGRFLGCAQTGSGAATVLCEISETAAPVTSASLTASPCLNNPPVTFSRELLPIPSGPTAYRFSIAGVLSPDGDCTSAGSFFWDHLKMDPVPLGSSPDLFLKRGNGIQCILDTKTKEVSCDFKIGPEGLL
jgi:hypothetical protein